MFHLALFQVTMKYCSARTIIRIATINHAMNKLVWSLHFWLFRMNSVVVADLQDELHELFLELAENGLVGIFRLLWEKELLVAGVRLIKEKRTLRMGHRVAMVADHLEMANYIHQLEPSLFETVNGRKYRLQILAERGDYEEYRRCLGQMIVSLVDYRETSTISSCVHGSLPYARDIDFLRFIISSAPLVLLFWPYILETMYELGRLELVEHCHKELAAPPCSSETIWLLKCPHPNAYSMFLEQVELDPSIDIIALAQKIPMISSVLMMNDGLIAVSSAVFLDLVRVLLSHFDQSQRDHLQNKLKKLGYDYIHSEVSKLFIGNK